MPNQKNSFIQVMEQVSKLNANSNEIIAKLNDVVTSKQNNVTINYENSEGSQSQYELPSVGKLKSDIDELNQNIKKMAGLEGKTYVMDGESAKKVFTIDLPEEPSNIGTIDTIDNFSRGQNWFFETLMNPKLSVKIDLKDKIDERTTKVVSRRYIVRFERNADGTLTPAGETARADFVDKYLNKSGIKIEEFHNWLQKETIQNGVINNTSLENFKLTSVDEETFDLNYKKTNYKGLFSVLKTETDSTNNKFWYHLNTLQYQGRDGSVKTLKKGDILNITNNNTKNRVQEVSDANDNFKVRLERKEGLNPIPVGNNVLEYYSSYTSDKSINVTIGYDEYNVIFLKPINTDNNVIGSLWSEGTAFYNNDLILDVDNNQTLEDFYQTVDDYGNLLKDLIRRKVPASDAIVPNPVELNESNFKVVQINKHLTNNENSKTIKEKVSQKNSVRKQLEAKREEINKQNRKINTGEVSDQQNAREKLGRMIDQRNQLTKELESLTNDITEILTTSHSERSEAKSRHERSD